MPCAACNTVGCCVQGLRHRIKYCSAFNRPYRCIVKNVKGYIMEELGNLIFIGCYIARCGPPAFQALWKHLQPALHHYIYGYEDTWHTAQAAHRHAREYATLLEQLVLQGKVGLPSLTPDFTACVGAEAA